MFSDSLGSIWFELGGKGEDLPAVRPPAVRKLFSVTHPGVEEVLRFEFQSDNWYPAQREVCSFQHLA